MKQSIWAQSATPNYPVGYRIQVGLRVFHYCRAITALWNKRGEGDGGTMLEMLNATVVGNIGDITVQLVTAAPVVNEYKGGYFAAFDAAALLPTINALRIKDNDAPVGANTLFHLQDPLTRALRIAGADSCDVYHNIYNNVETSLGSIRSEFESKVCVPLIDVTINNYFWGQTWGPCLGIAADAGGIGAVANERGVYFQEDGAIGIFTHGSITSINQYAGYMLQNTTPGDSLFYMLQLAP
ncbi:hypothetical protein ES703_45310 [subsurface metagenome]